MKLEKEAIWISPCRLMVLVEKIVGLIFFVLHARNFFSKAFFDQNTVRKKTYSKTVLVKGLVSNIQ